MNLIKALVIMIAFLTFSSSTLHAMGEIEKKFKKYASIFGKTDPESIFNEDKKFDAAAFEKFVEEFITQLKEKPEKIGKAKFVEFICLLRAIAAYSRIDDQVMPLLATLPLENVLNELSRGLTLLHLDSQQAFEKLFYTDEREQKSVLTAVKQAVAKLFNADERVIKTSMLNYLKLENDTALAGDLILFLFLTYEMNDEHIEEIKMYKDLIVTANKEALSRLKSMINSQLKTVATDDDALQKMANDPRGAFYHTGARFNIVGRTIADREVELMKLEEELNTASADVLIDDAEEKEDGEIRDVDDSFDDEVVLKSDEQEKLVIDSTKKPESPRSFFSRVFSSIQTPQAKQSPPKNQPKACRSAAHYATSVYASDMVIMYPTLPFFGHPF